MAISCASGKQEQPHLRHEASFVPKAPIKIGMTTEGGRWHTISVVILIRTDTTLDQSQKAEKVQLKIALGAHLQTNLKRL